MSYIVNCSFNCSSKCYKLSHTPLTHFLPTYCRLFRGPLPEQIYCSHHVKGHAGANVTVMLIQRHGCQEKPCKLLWHCVLSQWQSQRFPVTMQQVWFFRILPITLSYCCKASILSTASFSQLINHHPGAKRAAKEQDLPGKVTPHLSTFSLWKKKKSPIWKWSIYFHPLPVTLVV